ncbi:PLP-dependent transferase [Streptomyces sp. NPDC050549]|uniref:PLP-dependent transferase n=1 Tax=Streptomyces sp. NPDC050549 TaxID=3155406 RepID=UPI0034308CA1
MPGSSTNTVHADREVHPIRAVAPPIYQTAAFSAEDAETFAQGAVAPRGKDFYTRFGNPNHAQVAAVVAELEHTDAAMVTASGMAALTTAVLALVSAGDHVIGQKSTYGGTASVLLNLLPRLGVSTTLVDQTDPESFARALTPQTRLILLETPSNPLLQITDLRAVADLTHGQVDNERRIPVKANRKAKHGLLTTGAACAELGLMTESASAYSAIVLSGRGYGVVTTGGTYVYACDTKADNWGVRTEYYTSRGVTDIVVDANGSASGCGGESPTGGGHIVRARVCAGVSGANASCTSWYYYPW